MVSLTGIFEKVKSGARISTEDALTLFEKADLLELGQLADEVNRKKNGVDVYYNVNRHINPTNVCAMSCKFCAFSRKPGQEGAYEYSIDDMVGKATEAVEQGATEVHMVGGLHPRWPFTKYLEFISAIKHAHPDLHIKAFTAVEIDWLSAKARMSIEDTLRALKESGLGSMPGGGAEIFHPEIRDQICDTKTDANRWIDIHRTAHSVGLRSNSTMLYGHIENYSHRVDHLDRLRNLQDETNGFNVFIPLAFQPYDNDMGIDRYTPGFDDLRTIAVSRIFLDNFKHIKAYWVMLGQDIAQVALNFGANDLDGTVTEEKISRMAGGQAGVSLSKQEIQSIIRKTKRVPVERDTLYNAVRRDNEADTLLIDKENETKSSMILYRCQHGEPLTVEQAHVIAESGNLFHLAELAKLLNERESLARHASVSVSIPKLNAASFASDKTFIQSLEKSLKTHGPIAQNLVIDLGDDEIFKAIGGIDRLADLIKLTKQERAIKAVVCLQGLKAIWRLALDAEKSYEEVIRQLSTAGVDTIESSPSESEDDLTTSEVMDFHRTCHSHDINTVAKVELSANFSGTDQPFWERYVKRLFELNRLNQETSGINAVSVEVAPSSRVTPVEYLRAVSLARIMGSTISHILSSFDKIPLIQRDGSTRMSKLAQTLKIAPLTLTFGAMDLGHLDVEEDSPETVLGELHSSGIFSELRDVKFKTLQLS